MLSLFPLRAPKARQRSRFNRPLRHRLQVDRSLICILVKSEVCGLGWIDIATEAHRDAAAAHILTAAQQGSQELIRGLKQEIRLLPKPLD